MLNWMVIGQSPFVKAHFPVIAAQLKNGPQNRARAVLFRSP